MKFKIDLKTFKDFPNNEIFVRGKDFLPNDPEPIVFVAVKGGIEDWALYYKYDSYGSRHFQQIEDFFQDIKQTGDKIHDRETLKSLVPVTDEVLALYRD